MEGIVGLSVKERARLVELEQVKAGRQTVVAAAERLQMSGRQAKRIWKRYRAEGAKGLVHRSRGRPSNRMLDPESKRQSLELCRSRLEGFGPTLAAEKLLEVGLRVSHETLRRWLIREGLWKKKRKRGPHRRWRPPKEHFGELVQMDGSFHDWLETGDKPCLIDLVDDATAKMGGEFFEQETTEGAMRVLWRWVELYGIPRALYTDHKNLYVADREPTVQEQLAGRPALTAFGKACHKLSIQIIPAASPQAKGRIERRHGVLQDRLVKELRLRGIKDLESANGFLSSEFLESVNEKFGHGASSRVDYHRPVPKGLRLQDVFVFEDKRTVQNDWTVAWEGCWFQITGPKAQMPRRREKIVVRRRLDGSRVLLHHRRALEFHEIKQRPPRPAPLIKPTSVATRRPFSTP
ncbi:MAG: ISNCY family transposase, partial [Thermoanaerobaculia bacterium]